MIGLRAAGVLLTAVGILGVFLPLLPSTVFFLGAAACFGKSWPAAHRWLTTNRLFGRQLQQYQREKGATMSTKLFSISSLWLGIGASAYFMQPAWWVDGLLAAIAIGVTWHLAALRTLRP
ncbi:MAG: YbaN family protein [Dehalococcoidia bacterium]